MVEFAWLEGEHLSSLPVPTLPEPLPQGRMLSIGTTAARLTMGAEEVHSIDNVGKYDDDTFELVVAADFFQVPPTYVGHSMGPGSALETVREVARVLEAGGMAYLHLWAPWVYVLVHHGETLGSVKDALLTPKVAAEAVTSAFAALPTRLEARREFESFLPERIEVLGWYPTFVALGSIPAVGDAMARIARFMPHHVSSSALLVIRKRHPRIDSNGGWS